MSTKPIPPHKLILDVLAPYGIEGKFTCCYNDEYEVYDDYMMRTSYVGYTINQLKSIRFNNSKQQFLYCLKGGDNYFIPMIRDAVRTYYIVAIGNKQEL